MASAKSVYQCFDCPTSTYGYSPYKALMQHRMQHSLRFQCPKCKQRFAGKRRLIGHQRIHGGSEGIYECDDCMESFPYFHMLPDHFMRRHCPDYYRIVRCHKAALQRGQASHRKQREVFCYDCDKRVFQCGTKNLFEHHLRRHNLKLYRHLCRLCRKSFMDTTSLRLHVKSRHNAGTRTQQHSCICDCCDKKYDAPGWRAILTVHCQEVHSKEKRLFRCNMCPSRFKSAANLHNHLRCTHATVARKCPICEKTFSNPQSFRKHLELHRDTTGKASTCDDCDASVQRQNVSVHVKIHRNQNDFRYVCYDCGHAFATCSASVWSHYTTMHLIESSRLTRKGREKVLKAGFPCRFWKRSFYQRAVMRLHERIHSGHWPYECDRCSKGFERRSHLEYHFQKNSKNNLLTNQCWKSMPPRS